MHHCHWENVDENDPTIMTPLQIGGITLKGTHDTRQQEHYHQHSKHNKSTHT